MAAEKGSKKGARAPGQEQGGRLAGKRALVTGASRGTGAAIAREFIDEGAQVVLADLSDESGTALAKELGPRARYLHLDVTEESDWKAAIASLDQHEGGLDVLVNNAAILHLAAIEDTGVEEFERVVRVNQLGTFLGIRSAIEPMRREGRGSIVNIASIDAMQGKNGVMAYASSKWAVRGMTRVAAIELGKFGIRVNAVCPEAGSADMMKPYIPEGIDIEMIAARSQPRLATQRDRTIADRIRDIAKLTVFLASDDSASCTGADFKIEGGNTAGQIIKGAPGA